MSGSWFTVEAVSLILLGDFRPRPIYSPFSRRRAVRGPPRLARGLQGRLDFVAAEYRLCQVARRIRCL